MDPLSYYVHASIITINKNSSSKDMLKNKAFKGGIKI